VAHFYPVDLSNDLVGGSINITLSPAEFDWMMRTRPAAATLSEARARTARTPMPNRTRGRRRVLADDVMDQPP
jgi:hypothetical protein